jgi:hypothetical protein
MLGKMFSKQYWTVNDVRKILKETGNLNLKIILWPTSNTTLIMVEVFQQNKTGRYFTIERILFFKNLMK